MVDLNWFYSTMAQSAAAIVGLVGAFLTTKTVNVYSERKSLLSRMQQLTSEIEFLEAENRPLEEFCNTIRKKAVEDKIISFFNRYIEENDEKFNDLSTVPSVEELIVEFGKSENVPLDKEYFEKYYNEHIVVIAQYRQRTPHLFRSMMDTKLLNFQSSGAAEIAVYNTNLFIKRSDQLESNLRQIQAKRELIQSLKFEFEAKSISNSMYFGAIILGYLAIVGILMPLWVMPIEESVDDFSIRLTLFWLFSFGLVALIFYITNEIRVSLFKKSRGWRFFRSIASGLRTTMMKLKRNKHDK